MNYYNYFTEIEEHFARRRGKHLLVSPMDWSLIAAWRSSGVPLHVALRGIDRAIDSFHARVSRPTARVNTLFYCHDAVMEEYANYLESRLGDQPGNPVESNGGPGKKTILEFLTSRISEIQALRVKHYEKETARLTEVLDRVRARLEEIAADLEAGQRIDCESLQVAIQGAQRGRLILLQQQRCDMRGQRDALGARARRGEYLIHRERDIRN